MTDLLLVPLLLGHLDDADAEVRAAVARRLEAVRAEAEADPVLAGELAPFGIALDAPPEPGRSRISELLAGRSTGSTERARSNAGAWRAWWRANGALVARAARDRTL